MKKMSGIKESMNMYYDERASEYDEIYTLGKGPASIKDPDVYKQDVLKVKEVVGKRITHGIVLDIPCGTAFWMPSYVEKAERIILVDQSINMIGKAKERAEELGCINKCEFINSDVFQLDDIKSPISFVLTGFFISHLTNEEEVRFFDFLKKISSNDAKIVMIDSTWSQERAKSRQKEGNQERTLNNGTKFEIYKKYFTVQDIEEMAERNKLKLSVDYFGATFLVAKIQWRNGG